jgi:hypothetical protein
MSAEMKFFIYLLEHVAEHKNTTADKILAQWDAAGITEKVYGMYEQYHAEAIENAFEDIDALLQKSLAANK